MSMQQHWSDVYATKGAEDVSWFQDSPQPSFDLVRSVASTGSVIDIGGGSSRLVDALLADGYGNLAVLDLSEDALTISKERLADAASKVEWIVADVTAWSSDRQYDVWHDRAAFHFLTDETSRAAYRDRLWRTLKPAGHAVIATFAADGPTRCSNLPVMRYDA